MRCSACEVKDRTIADMTLELAAWRSAGRRDDANADRVERRDRWARGLKLAPAPTRVLIALVDAAPRHLSFDQLVSAAKPGREVAELEYVENLARQYVSICRAAMKGGGAQLTIRPVRGEGYQVDAAEAKAFRTAMGDA